MSYSNLKLVSAVLIKVVYFAFFFFLTTSVYAVGTLTINESDETLVCTVGIPTNILSNVEISNGATAWQGGRIVVKIDAGPDNAQIVDLLTCTLASDVMTSSYDTATKALTITANNTITFAQLQSTLRSIKLTLRGAQSYNRVVRIFVLENTNQASYVPLLYNNHIYVIDRTNRTNANSQIFAEGLTHYGLKGYLATITSEQERVAFSNSLVYLSNGDNVWYHIGATYTTTAPAGFYWTSGPESGTNTNIEPIYTPSGVNGKWEANPPSPLANGSKLSLDDDLNTGANGAKNYQFDANTASDSGGALIEFGGYTSGANRDRNIVNIAVVIHNSLRFGNPY